MCRPKKKMKKSRERETRKANEKRVTAACTRVSSETGFVYLRLENTADQYNERISDMLQQRGGGPVIIQIMRRRGCAT